MCFVCTLFDREKDKGLVALLCFLWLAVVIMSFCCLQVTYQTLNTDYSHLPNDSAWMALRTELYTHPINLDSLSSDDKEWLKQPTTMRELNMVVETQRTLIARQDKLADDLRQEANNVINKANGWLAFWITVMTLLGVLLPSIMAFKQHKDAREDAKRLETRQKEALSETQDSLREKNREINAALADLKESVDENLKRNKEEFGQLEVELNEKVDANITKFSDLLVTAASRNFGYVCSSKALAKSSERNQMLRSIWTTLMTGLQLQIKRYRTQDPNDTLSASSQNCAASQLAVSLVHVADALSFLHTAMPRRTRIASQLEARCIQQSKDLFSPTISHASQVTALNDLYAALNLLSNHLD